MICLDTNVLSELMHKTPDTNVVAWLDKQPRTSVWTTSISVLEVRYGLYILADGKRRDFMTAIFDRVLNDYVAGRMAAFDGAAAERAAELMALRRRKGRQLEFRDAMIAGIVVDRNATLATRNTADFDDLTAPVINPWLAEAF